MDKWNEQSAPNNNLPPSSLKTGNFLGNSKKDHEFSEELSDGGERDQFIKRHQNDLKMK
jgi:hypothetical protein